MSNFYNNQMSEKKANSVGKGKKTMYQLTHCQLKKLHKMTSKSYDGNNLLTIGNTSHLQESKIKIYQVFFRPNHCLLIFWQ